MDKKNKKRIFFFFLATKKRSLARIRFMKKYMYIESPLQIVESLDFVLF